MIKQHTASIKTGLLRSTPLENADRHDYPSNLNKAQVEFTIELFNCKCDFTPDEVKTLQPMLLAVLIRAARGLGDVLAHLNDTGFQIRGNFKDFIESNPKVFLRNYDN
jgi:hypothetical protein